MKAFANLMKNINALDDSHKAGSEAYKQAVAAANANFKGKTLEAKVSELSESLSSYRAEQIRVTKESATADFEQVRRALKAMITEPVPADFTATLAAVQAMGKHLSETDAEVLLEKYSGNYLASKCLIEVLHDNGIAEGHVVRNAAEALSACDELETKVSNWIDTHAGEIGESDGLSNALFLSENTSPVSEVAAKIDAISDSGFVD